MEARSLVMRRKVAEARSQISRREEAERMGNVGMNLKQVQVRSQNSEASEIGIFVITYVV